jgi:hypothetical protein
MKYYTKAGKYNREGEFNSFPFIEGVAERHKNGLKPKYLCKISFPRAEARGY